MIGHPSTWPGRWDEAHHGQQWTRG